MTTMHWEGSAVISDKEYKRRIWAWTMYDWANSGFATTIMAAVLPIYFSQVAGSTLPSAATATSIWSLGLSISLLIAAVISPILGTVSDIMRGKKRLLAIFAGIGILGTGLLVFVDTGDWMLASILVVIGRIGFSGANVFYDALLPHVARQKDQDRVSARGYAFGYLGGGLLLAINVVMIQFIDGTLGSRLSFLSVAVWWAIFSIPLFRVIPEPPAALAKLAAGQSVLAASIKRLGETLRDVRQYKQLFKFVLSFLIYIDGIGTIIGVAAIYGTELGLGSVELVLALLMVQFVGIPFSIIFGRLPSQTDRRKPFYLAFILFNVIALPVVGVWGARMLDPDISGIIPVPYARTANAVGEGIYLSTDPGIVYTGTWETIAVSAENLGTRSAADYRVTGQAGAQYDINFNGQRVNIAYSTGPDHGIWAVEIDGQPVIDADTGQPVEINGYNPTLRYDVSDSFTASSPGEHVLSLINTGRRDPASSGTQMSVSSVEILPPLRESNLLFIVGLIAAIQVFAFLLAWLLGPLVLRGISRQIDTKRAILIALFIYSLIAIWGYFINSVIEFWFLAWMVSIVQGGSQALSRSLFSVMAPASKSGEFFGLFGVMEKFSSIIGPLIFALAVTTFNSSRPAILSVIAFFIVGGYLLTRVDVEEGRRVAQEEDERMFRAEREAGNLPA